MAKVVNIPETRNSFREHFWQMIGQRLDEAPPRFLHPAIAQKEAAAEAEITLARDSLKEKLGSGHEAYEIVDEFESALTQESSLSRDAGYLLGLMDGLELAQGIKSGILRWIVDDWAPEKPKAAEEASA